MYYPSRRRVPLGVLPRLGVVALFAFVLTEQAAVLADERIPGLLLLGEPGSLKEASQVLRIGRSHSSNGNPTW